MCDFWRNGFDFEKINYRWSLLFFPIVIGWMSYAVLKSNPYSIHNEWDKIHTIESFNDVVARKWIKRGKAYFILKDSTKGIGYNIIFKKLDIGDSLIKKSNSKIYKIVKPDTIIFVNLIEEFKQLDSLIKTGKY